MSGAVPAALGTVLTPIDGEILNSIESLNVERYQIKSDTEGEPRSIRFTFHFAENNYFSDTTVVKDFEYKAFGDGPGGYVSTPLNFKWKKQAKKQGLNAFLDLAEQLYQAEQALVSNGGIEQKERESLWQYEKLREEMEKEEDKAEENDGHSFLEWFGYRGAVNTAPKSKPKNGDAEGDSDDEDEDEDDGMLDVEIFPAGEDVAIAIAEDLWPNVMDYFIQATSEDVEMDSDEDDEDDEDIPELVEADDALEEKPEDDPRPVKKRKTTS